MQLKSKFHPVTEIEHVDGGGGQERFVLTSDGMSYAVLPSGRGMTSGDVSAAMRCPPPNAITDGSVVRVSTIHDAYASRLAGKPTGTDWVSRLQVISSRSQELPSGSYFELDTYGRSTSLRPANPATPVFVGVFQDVTDDFVRLAKDGQVQARIDMGRVFQRLCVDTDPSRAWHFELAPGIVFAGSIAPGLAVMGSRERDGLLMEAGFDGVAHFMGSFFLEPAQTMEHAEILLSTSTYLVALPAPEQETLDYYRLHSDESVQDECYAEMIGDAAAGFSAMPSPNLVNEVLNRHAPLMAM